MTIENGKFEIYVPGLSQVDFVSKNYVEAVLEQANFGIADSILDADFILMLNEFADTFDYIQTKPILESLDVEFAENLYDLHRLRDDYEFREGAVR